jgi:trehalose synthase
VTSLVSEHFNAPGSAREARALGAARDRAGDTLAGSTVWCATALARARRPAQELRERLDGASPGLVASPLQVATDAPLQRLAELVDAMLAGTAPAAGRLGASEHDVYAEGARSGDRLSDDHIRAGDVVVAHDPLSAMLALEARERGAHAVWHVRSARPSPAALEALEFLRAFTTGVDAYILTWLEPGPRGEPVECVAAVMPSAGVVATKDFRRVGGGAADPRRLAWRAALAEVVSGDRGENVGGTLHPRPSVAVR